MFHEIISEIFKTSVYVFSSFITSLSSAFTNKAMQLMDQVGTGVNIFKFLHKLTWHSIFMYLIGLLCLRNVE